MEADEEIKGLHSNMSKVQGRYDEEASTVRTLKEDLMALKTKLARMRAKNAMPREQEAAAVLRVHVLQGHTDRLAAELKESVELQLEREAGC